MGEGLLPVYLRLKPKEVLEQRAKWEEIRPGKRVRGWGTSVRQLKIG